jgi:charged multivesicular body protein 5
MKAASAEMKHTMKHELNITDVDELADDMAEMMDEFNEINEALASNWATPADIDEADLEAELDMLADELEEEETLLENSTTLPSYLQQQQDTTSMPSIPTAPLVSKVSLSAGGATGGQKVDEYGLPL